ncbi:hypothetical protein O9G_005607 [Rozella allomycis CSF55]|uniref:Uncharacterized protein n=1 Tax=Rozella allomycis (strain CSF55) TaxID=988480 RepID=A0A075B2E4_ROZAC|nr:hypothetical protein O9G_005607 [Rozella allomycis CSF55]|eukprot:EPZ35096.1 hypothetical protein O9G_005607 [Rozella allomycis CSF55]
MFEQKKVRDIDAVVLEKMGVSMLYLMMTGLLKTRKLLTCLLMEDLTMGVVDGRLVPVSKVVVCGINFEVVLVVASIIGVDELGTLGTVLVDIGMIDVVVVDRLVVVVVVDDEVRIFDVVV